jgi:hypothetical protein
MFPDLLNTQDLVVIPYGGMPDCAVSVTPFVSTVAADLKEEPEANAVFTQNKFELLVLYNATELEFVLIELPGKLNDPSLFSVK